MMYVNEAFNNINDLPEAETRRMIRSCNDAIVRFTKLCEKYPTDHYRKNGQSYLKELINKKNAFESRLERILKDRQETVW